MENVSVLIKGKKMPNNCIECPLQFGGICYASPCDVDVIIAETVDEAAKQGKPDWCPLVEFKTDDVAPVVHGHWKNVKRVLNSKWGECSNCDRANEFTRYCPYCGAKMDEGVAEP